jgi:hypothetical protein
MRINDSLYECIVNTIDFKLCFNHREWLKPGLFDRFKDPIKSVNLTGDSSTIIAKTFSANQESLKNIESLRLFNIAIKIHSHNEEKAGLFEGLVNLKELEISDCPYLDSISKKLFTNLNKLEKLKVNIFKGPDLKFHPEAFATLSNLIELDLDTNNYVELLPFMFSNLHSLQVLKIKLKSTKNISELGSLKKLKILDLNTSRCETVDASLFGYITCLEELKWIMYVLPNYWNNELNLVRGLRKLFIHENSENCHNFLNSKSLNLKSFYSFLFILLQFCCCCYCCLIEKRLFRCRKEFKNFIKPIRSIGSIRRALTK